MKIAVISDIHGNIYSLMRVLDDINDQNVDLIICLGDLIGYGPHPNEVVALIQRRKIPCIKGNYDASVISNSYSFIRNTSINSFSLPWTYDETRIANKYFIDSLPESLNYTFENFNFKFLHGSPNSINEYLYEDNENLTQILNSLDEDVLVCAHTHIPYVKKVDKKLLINVGSVGKPKYGKPLATYYIIEINNTTITPTLREVEYEYSKIIKDMQILKFPSELISSYSTGRE